MIAEYLSGNLEPARKAELEDWVNESDENRRYFMRCEEIWFSAVSEEELEKYDADKAFEAFRRKVEAAGKRTARVGTGRRWRTVLRYAAAVAVLCLVAHFAYRQGGQDLQDTLAQIEVEAPEGSQTRMRLPDGTLVVLNAGSRMVYGQDFGVENREVELEGEGYFEVASNADRPFIVESDKQNILVTGTRFNINSYPADNVIETTLLEGRIIFNLSEGNKSIVMRPGEQIIYNHAENTIEVKRPENPDDAIDWIDSRYEFDGIPLHDILWQMKNVYNVTFSCSDIKALETKYNVTFYQGESLKEFIRIVSNMSGLSCVERNDTIVFQ